MSLADKTIGELSYAEVVIGVIIAWVLVALWQRCVENISYTACGLDPKSAFHAFLVAVVVTVIFFVLISTVNSLAQGFLIGDTTAAPAAVGDTPSSNYDPNATSTIPGLTTAPATGGRGDSGSGRAKSSIIGRKGLYSPYGRRPTTTPSSSRSNFYAKSTAHNGRLGIRSTSSRHHIIRVGRNPNRSHLE